MNFSILFTLIITILELIFSYYCVDALHIHFLQEIYNQYSIGVIGQTIFRGVLVFAIYFLISSIVGIFAKRLNQQSIDQIESYFNEDIDSKFKESKQIQYLNLIDKINNIKNIKVVLCIGGILICLIIIAILVFLSVNHPLIHLIFVSILILTIAGIRKNWGKIIKFIHQDEFLLFSEKEKEIQSTREFQEFYEIYLFFRSYKSYSQNHFIPLFLFSVFCMVIFFTILLHKKIIDFSLFRIGVFYFTGLIGFCFALIFGLKKQKLKENPLYKKYFSDTSDTITNLPKDKELREEFDIQGNEKNVLKSKKRTFLSLNLVLLILFGFPIIISGKFLVFLIAIILINILFFIIVILPDKIKIDK